MIHFLSHHDGHQSKVWFDTILHVLENSSYNCSGFSLHSTIAFLPYGEVLPLRLLGWSSLYRTNCMGGFLDRGSGYLDFEQGPY